MRETMPLPERPYFPISQFYREKFGGKIWKIPVAISETCPNREGLRGMKPCNFCDVWGSAAYPENLEKSLHEQIQATRKTLSRRYNVDQFLIYFQAYTSTFSRVDRLRRQFEVALEYSDVKGVVIGTRPDCISDAVFELWNEYLKKTFVAVELGVQSFDEEQLLWMSRGHTAKKSIQSIMRIRKYCPQIDLGIHLIFGLPGETIESIAKTAHLVNELPINNVKLHNLHVLKNTPLEQEYLRGDFTPLEQREYAEKVEVFLQHLRPDMAVHRLTAVASRHDEIVAPQWVGHKMRSYQYVLDFLAERGSYQGQSFIPLSQ